VDHDSDIPTKARMSTREVVTLVSGNTVIMVASVVLFYLVVIHGLSTNETLIAVLVYAVLAGLWLLGLRAILAPYRR
jgi:hypothetical protein